MHWYYWLIVAICALFSMFFSAADMVYGIVDKERLIREKGKKEKRAKLAIKIADDYELSISAILLGNNIVNIFASSIVTLIGLALSSNPEIGTVITTIIFTAFIIIFCEFIPKAFAKRFNYSLAILFAYPVTFFKYLFFVIVWPIAKLFKLFGKLFAKKSKEEDKIDEDVLTEMVDTIEEEGILEENEAELLRSAIDLNDIEAYEIMTPRVDVFAIDVEDDIDELIKDKEIFKHSRIPVYEETIDNIVGILPIKVLAKKLLAGEKVSDILSMCYKPLVVPRNHQILDLLKEFKNSKVHIAVVIDEYGGTDGIVTMEDILEEIVGEIFDEADEIMAPNMTGAQVIPKSNLIHTRILGDLIYDEDTNILFSLDARLIGKNQRTSLLDIRKNRSSKARKVFAFLAHLIRYDGDTVKLGSIRNKPPVAYVDLISCL